MIVFFDKCEDVFKSFSEIGTGMSYQLGKIRFGVDATNIFNTIGLTEGDPRSGAGTGNTIMERPILGAALRGSITMEFKKTIISF